MYVRLAFAVAAHLQPEILIVDEVLAVGDVDFQKKCIDKMKEVSKAGRTLLFVSHNLQTIRAVCKSCMVLKQGKIQFTGPTHEAINHYAAPSQVSESKGIVKFDENTERYGTGEVLMEEIIVTNSKGEPSNAFCYGEGFTIEIKCRVIEPISNLTLFLSTTDKEDNFHGYSYTCDKFPNPCPDSGCISFKLKSRSTLLPGKHIFLPCLSNMNRAIDQIQRAFEINVLHQGRGNLPSFPLEEVKASIRLEGDWQIDNSEI
jgi:lipopolysaccharide transport system ATP-binding protein